MYYGFLTTVILISNCALWGRHYALKLCLIVKRNSILGEEKSKRRLKMYDRQARIIGTAITIVYIVLLRLRVYFFPTTDVALRNHILILLFLFKLKYFCYFCIYGCYLYSFYY